MTTHLLGTGVQKQKKMSAQKHISDFFRYPKRWSDALALPVNTMSGRDSYHPDKVFCKAYFHNSIKLILCDRMTTYQNQNGCCLLVWKEKHSYSYICLNKHHLHQIQFDNKSKTSFSKVSPSQLCFTNKIYIYYISEQSKTWKIFKHWNWPFLL